MFVLLGAAALLTGCGDGGEDTAAVAAQTPTPAPTPTATPTPSPAPTTASTEQPNRSPTIAGLPLGAVMVGTQYSFTPTAADADGDILTFSISGKPSWATFTTTTGRLRGTPTQADVGSSSNIVISATDGAATVALNAFTINVVATAAGSVTLSWQPPSENDDGTPLSDLAGYKVYWGTSQGNYTNSIAVTNAGITSYVVEQLTPATWYFVTTAINSNGVESDYSNVASKTIS
jgi:hypothetical protein